MLWVVLGIGFRHAATAQSWAIRSRESAWQVQIMAGLHPQPEALAQAEETTQAQIGVGIDRTPPLHECIYAAFGQTNRLRQSLLADPHRSQKLLQHHLA